MEIYNKRSCKVYSKILCALTLDKFALFWWDSYRIEYRCRFKLLIQISNYQWSMNVVKNKSYFVEFCSGILYATLKLKHVIWQKLEKLSDRFSIDCYLSSWAVTGSMSWFDYNPTVLFPFVKYSILLEGFRYLKYESMNDC